MGCKLGLAVLTRRQFQLAAICAGVAPPQFAYAQGNQPVTVRIRADERVRSILQPIEEQALSIEPDQSAEAKALAKQVPANRAIPIFVIIVGAIAATELLKMIRELYRQTYYGGVLIDTRTKPPVVTSDPKIPANMVFVVDTDGKITRYTGDNFDLGALKLTLNAK